ncbi:prolyl-tRNA synthetase [Patescibacteria group bacterium]|nr:prolyl-tRNA synthetase [Patescibacteria group bacterium]MBU1124271.1 prolyl-tRNA synthetase [Patescibacteria group bacterium]MBU1910948.1 prolyl-tRNA synthetase [Patescibacteria group bacterium]
MLLSKLFTKTSKDTVADADSINADLLVRSGFVNKTMAGVYSYLPLGLRVLKKIEQIVREEMNAIDGQEIVMSAFAPKEYWEKAGRWDNTVFESLFHVPAAGDKEYALNPTHEEVVVPLVKNFVQSYKDLPFYTYQIQTKFRNEKRAKSGILRGREFLMKDLYSFHRDGDDLDKYYERAQGAYWKIMERLGLGEISYLTYATGGSFSKYSHEYQVVLPQGEDTIYISEDAEKKGKRIAVNSEIYEEGKTVCPETGGNAFRKASASEAANIFKLGTKFSEPFDLMFTDDKGKRHPIIMGCYGIGISRLMGIIAEAFADDSGLVWPASVAPAAAHIIPLAKDEKEESFKKAKKLYEDLTKKGVECLFDDRLSDAVGSRMADADLMGVPKRLVISAKSIDGGGVEVKDRASGDVTIEDFKKVFSLLVTSS